MPDRAVSESCDTAYRIRPFRRDDRPAVRSICGATAWLGEPAGEHVADEWIWAEFWTRYFTDRDWRDSWVVESRGDAAVAGYLTGTADIRGFDGYVPFLLPGIVLRVVRRRLIRRRGSRRAILGLLRSLAAGELALPPGIAEAYPATFHLNLLPEARRKGFGSALFARFVGRMRARGVGGVHAQPLSINPAIQRLLGRAGFRRVASRPCHAFSHAEPAPIDVQTWIMPLGGAAGAST